MHYYKWYQQITPEVPPGILAKIHHTAKLLEEESGINLRMSGEQLRSSATSSRASTLRSSANPIGERSRTPPRAASNFIPTNVSGSEASPSASSVEPTNQPSPSPSPSPQLSTPSSDDKIRQSESSFFSYSTDALSVVTVDFAVVYGAAALAIVGALGYVVAGGANSEESHLSE